MREREARTGINIRKSSMLIESVPGLINFPKARKYQLENNIGKCENEKCLLSNPGDDFSPI